MRVEIFPRCCGAGVLVLEHLTGKGEEADLEEIKRWVYYCFRNGYYMYDYPHEYGGQAGVPKSSIAVIGGAGDKTDPSHYRSWGMLLAITNPGQVEAGQRLQKFGFRELFKTHNPVYGKAVNGSQNHPITLWGLDLNGFTEEQLKPKAEAKPTVAEIITATPAALL